MVACTCGCFLVWLIGVSGFFVWCGLWWHAVADFCLLVVYLCVGGWMVGWVIAYCGGCVVYWCCASYFVLRLAWV